MFSYNNLLHWIGHDLCLMFKGHDLLKLRDLLGTIYVALFVLAVAIVIMLYVYYRRVYSFWSSLGVKTPKPWPLFGNSLELVLRHRAELEVDWPQKYGRVYGFYQGTRPMLAVTDPEVIKTICIKDFHAFPNRHFNNFEFMNHHQQLFLSLLRDDRWRRVRNIITPTFTSGKIKRMFHLMDECCDELVQQFGAFAISKQLIHCKETFDLYVMNGITSCFYAIKLALASGDNLQSVGSRSTFVDTALKVVTPRIGRVLAMSIVPDSLLKFVGFKLTPVKPLEDMAQQCRALIEKRHKTNAKWAKRTASASNNKQQGTSSKYDDYLQTLLDAKLNDKLELDDNHHLETHHAGTSEASMVMEREHETKLMQDSNGNKTNTSNSGSAKGLSTGEVIANTMLFLSVGFDTTGALLTNAAYALAHHPRCQERLYDELVAIKKRAPKNGPSFDYDSLTAAVYLDSVVCETLRMMTPVLWQDRVAAEDYYLKEYDIMVPKGTVVNIGYYAVHHDAKYWPEPEKFDPSRFFPENRHKIAPCAYTPFGHGPRHCVGMRFSLAKTKLALSRLAIKFVLKPGPGTLFPPRSKFSLFINGYEEMSILTELRA